MARQFNYLKKRGNTYVIRVMIPKTIRHIYGRREITKSLHTSCVIDARFKGHNEVAKILAEFRQVRADRCLPLKLAETSISLVPAQPAKHEPLYSSMLFTTTERAALGPVPTILEAFEMYAEDNPRKVTEDTFRQSRYIVRLFAEFLGKDSLVTSINKAAVRGWRLALAEWPVKANEVAEFKGYTFPEILVLAREYWGRRARLCITQKTINKYLSALGGFCSWLVTATDYLEFNPVKGFYHKIDKSEQKVFPFSIDQLKTFFSTPLYVGCKSIEIDHEPGQIHVRDHRFWLPLISLYSGARLGEIAQLLTADVRESDGHWIFDITREGSSRKRTKTKGSQRVVPVHSQLIACGLLEYHDRQLSLGNERLFPEIEEDQRGQISGKPSRWFGRYMKRMKLREANRYNFHSFRHTATDALRRAGHADDFIAPLLGHSRPGMTRGYGIEPVGTIKQRVQMVESIFYDLDLSHLMEKERQENLAA